MQNMSLFSQILQLIPKRTFAQLVEKHNVEYRSKGFSSWDQFVSMLFLQFSQASSLREISYGLQSCEGKLSHLNIKAPKRSTLSYANNNRNWEFYKELFEVILAQIKSSSKLKGHKFSFSNKLYSIDASTIDLCLSVFEWAKYKATKGAIKLHMRLDHNGYLPDFVHISDGKEHDVTAAWHFPFERGSVSVFDRGYNDYSLFKHIDEKGAFFVTRLKSNAKMTIVKKQDLPTNSDCDIISDSIIKFDKGAYTADLRLILVKDVEDREIKFLTNNMELSAETISEIYRERWKIELFFKEIKQNLKIKTFVGTSENAVMTQVYTALITILLLKYLKLKSEFKWSMSNLATLIRMNLFTHKNLWEWINAPYLLEEDVGKIESKQMRMNFT